MTPEVIDTIPEFPIAVEPRTVAMTPPLTMFVKPEFPDTVVPLRQT